EVRRLQIQLMNLGYYAGDIDGDYDTATYNAVKMFQTANSLKASGKATTETRMMLNRGNGIGMAEFELVMPLESGDEGEAVLRIQGQLAELGYFADELNGKFGSSLKAAVKLFQSANGLDDSGKADVRTRTLLNSGKGMSAAEYNRVCPLKSGSKGEAVIILQQQLTVLEYFEGEQDGRYSGAVKDAVKAFQTANGLKATGNADRASRELMESDACVTGATYNLICPLEKGDEGVAVKVLQRQLAVLGYYNGDIDGDFGSCVRSAVKALQTANDLKDDGEADRALRELINSGKAVTAEEYDRIRPLKYGDKGDAVSLIQNQLTELGYYTGENDGKYSSEVKEAVEILQIANGMKDSGKADKATRELLNSGKAVTAAEYDRVRPLKSGNKGDAVYLVQMQLTELGFYADEADGKFDSGLKSAVKEFQTANGMKSTGTADVATRTLLNSGTGMSAAAYDRIRPLESGDKGEAVRLLQNQLTELGYYVDEITGKYSGSTKSAVSVFQTANGMKATGKADTATRTLINSGIAVTREQYDADRDLEKGALGSTVRSVQTRLAALGYTSAAADGVFDSDMRDAVKLFQKAHGLKETGIADVKLRELLFSGDAISFTEYECTRPLKSGDKGDAVRLVQQQLNKLGYYSELVDGRYGSSTKNAAELFQKANGLAVNSSVISAEMRKVLNDGKALTLSEYYWTVPLSEGDKGEAVKKLQTRLTELGYFTESVTGRYSDSTVMAVKVFQLANALDVTGEADAATRKVMNSAQAITKTQYEEDILLSGNEKIEMVIAVAKSKLGCKYVHKTHGPDTFDCSGFTRYAFKQVGIKLSAASYNQGYLDLFGKPYKQKLTSYSQLKRGDLLVFDTVKNDDDLSDHLGIYLGDGTFIHASSTKGKVVISNLISYGNFSWAFRLI
ncbi:MAG: peptidoglycan-binding protein, partial [Clostridia bacterium]|nr:peptidoglycan-binding protein [Clostridia bacterium]